MLKSKLNNGRDKGIKQLQQMTREWGADARQTLTWDVSWRKKGQICWYISLSAHRGFHYQHEHLYCFLHINGYMSNPVICLISISANHTKQDEVFNHTSNTCFSLCFCWNRKPSMSPLLHRAILFSDYLLVSHFSLQFCSLEVHDIGIVFRVSSFLMW